MTKIRSITKLYKTIQPTEQSVVQPVVYNRRQSINGLLTAVNTRPTFAGFVAELLEYHPQRQNALLQIDEAVVVSPELVQRRLDERQVLAQRLLVHVTDPSQLRDLHRHARQS